MRTLKAADFRPEAGKEKLLGLDVQTNGDQTMLYASVADEIFDAGDDCGGHRQSVQGSLMRLGTSINLDSSLTVSLKIDLRYV